MTRRTPWAVMTVVILALAAACVPGQDPTSSQADLHLEGFVFAQGADQTAFEGDTLPDLVVGQLKLTDGTTDHVHAVRVTIRSGNGGVFVSTGGMASGDGATIMAGWGTGTVRWILGPADEPQVLRFWSLGDDSVYADVHATALPRDGG